MDYKSMENEIRGIYNKMGESYLEKEKKNWEDKSIIDTFLSNIKNDNILDIGCGTGELLEYYSMRGFKVTGIDISDELLAIAKKRVQNSKMFNMNVFDIDKLDEDYNGISATYLLVHIPKNKFNNLINLISNKLQPNGILLLVFTDNNPAAKQNKNVINYSLNEVKKMLEKNDFEIVMNDTIEENYTLHRLIARKNNFN